MKRFELKLLGESDGKTMKHYLREIVLNNEFKVGDIVCWPDELYPSVTGVGKILAMETKYGFWVVCLRTQRRFYLDYNTKGIVINEV